MGEVKNSYHSGWERSEVLQCLGGMSQNFYRTGWDWSEFLQEWAGLVRMLQNLVVLVGIPFGEFGVKKKIELYL